MRIREMAVSASAVAGVFGAIALTPAVQLANNLSDGATTLPAPPSAASEVVPPSAQPTASAGAQPTAPADAAATTYTGSIYQSPWGPMQVTATTGGGQILDITWLSYPTDSKSIRINSRAAPALVEAALAAQSADVNGISGATFTSTGFRSSLRSALSQAGL